MHNFTNFIKDNYLNPNTCQSVILKNKLSKKYTENDDLGSINLKKSLSASNSFVRKSNDYYKSYINYIEKEKQRQSKNSINEI